MSRAANAALMHDSCVCRNRFNASLGVCSINCRTSRSLTLVGWCLISLAGGGIWDERRENLTTTRRTQDT